MVAKKCLDCGKGYEVEPNEVKWRNYCTVCYTIRMTLKEQGLSKEEIEKIRQLAKSSLTKVESVQETVEVITPAKEEKHVSTREEFDKAMERSMQFKEISVSLGEKVSVNFQSKNAQVGAVVSVGGVSIELAYQSALNFVRDRLRERVKEIREEML